METSSISLRLRRVTYEDAYIAVPVTDAIMVKSEDGRPKEFEDGNFRIDWDLLRAEAVRIGQDHRVDWKAESTAIEPHPTQMKPPDDRKRLDTFYDDPAGGR